MLMVIYDRSASQVVRVKLNFGKPVSLLAKLEFSPPFS